MSLFAYENKRNRHKSRKPLSISSKCVGNVVQTEACSCTCYRAKASIMVETAVALPLFVGFMVFLMFYFRIMQVQIGMEQAMAYTARVTAASTKDMEEEVSAAKLRLLLTARLKKEDVPLEYIDGGMGGISLSRSDYGGTQICIHAKYKTTLPIGFFGKLSHQTEQEVSARKWTGRVRDTDGKEEDSYVYVTQTGKAYHRTRDCAYLDLSIRRASALELKNLRNKSGGKYKACSSCCKKNQEASTYYITDYGGTYHRSLDCSGLKRTVYMVPLNKVGSRHACAKCTGG